MPDTAVDFTAAREALAAEDPYTSVHLPNRLADRLLMDRGWTIERVGPVGDLRDGKTAYAYVVPNGKLRQDGGKFGVDYLWQRDEALAWALCAEALA